MLQFEDFAGRLNESFSLDMGTGTIDMVLTETRPSTRYVYPGMLRAPFCLTFSSNTQVVLPQRIYSLKNEVMGRLDIFIVPVARNKDGIVYEAVFN